MCENNHKDKFGCEGREKEQEVFKVTNHLVSYGTTPYFKYWSRKPYTFDQAA